MDISNCYAFTRQDEMGAIPLAIEAAREKNVKVKILVPANNFLEQRVQQLKQDCHSCQIDVRYIEQMSDTKATILVIDRKDSLVMELRDDSKTTFYEAIGLSTYSNSKAGVLSYVAIFENLWRQSELYDELKEAHQQVKIHDKMQKDFIDVAAHELRNPIQPIVSLSEVAINHTKDREQAELLEVINRNAKRLHRLAEDILDVTKIESHTLKLNKEYFNLANLISYIVEDLKNDIQKKGSDIRLSLYEPDGPLLVYADKGRITQVLSNLLNNAIKFSKDGSIFIHLHKKEKEVLVSIKDTGTGIDPEILPKLFTKFASKSEKGGGTGLGLFISKSIIEAHGGRISAQNNGNMINTKEKRGATFSFTLPL